MRDLATVTPDDFEAVLGTVFDVTDTKAGPVVLLLRAVVRHRTRPGRRQSFSLDFVGPSSPILEQRTVALRNGEMGDLEIFLGPVATEDDAIVYEAVFN